MAWHHLEHRLCRPRARSGLESVHACQTLDGNGRDDVRKRLPTANELVYDNYNFFVIGYSPTEKPSDSIVSIAARANGVGLCFIHGAGLPDPGKLLLGSGRQTRFIRLE